MAALVFHDLDIIAGSSWEQARGYLREELERAQASINTHLAVAHNVDGTQKGVATGEILGQLTGTLAEQPTGLDADNDGLLYFVTDYGHMVRWNHSAGAWEFAPGDQGNGFFQDFAITPQQDGWALCDGSTVAYLVVGGASLTTANITLPNLTGTAAYRKSAAAYTGTIVAAAGATSSDGNHDHDTTQLNHAHSVLDPTELSALGLSTVDQNLDGATVDVVSSSGASHAHALAITTEFTDPQTTTSSDGAHTHSIGTLDPAHLNILPYFRR